MSGRVIAADDRYVAMATGPRTFAVLEQRKLSQDVSVGQRVKARVGANEIAIEGKAQGGVPVPGAESLNGSFSETLPRELRQSPHHRRRRTPPAFALQTERSRRRSVSQLFKLVAS